MKPWSTTRALYYLLLNKGKFPPGDMEAIGARMNLPFTITRDSARSSVSQLLKSMADDAKLEDQSIIGVNLQNYDFCHFEGVPGVFVPSKPQPKLKPVNRGNFCGSFRRVEETGC